MRAKAGFLILLGLFILMGTVSAYVADSASTIVAGKEWVVANNNDVSVITVVAKNLASGQYVPGAQVVFTIDDPAYGLMTAPTVTSDANGIATSSFKTKTRSGTAVITATITSADTYGSHTQVLTVNQKIDHDLPQNAVFDNPAQLPVGTVSTLTVTLKDRWGNLVDNKNPAEHHTFSLYMLGGQGRGFWDGSNYISIKQVVTDVYGNASTQYRIASVAGPNWIYMDTIGNMVSPPETWIEGISLDTPCYIYQQVPSPNDLRADGIDAFGLYYYVYDKYMNPVNNTQVQITASDGSSFSGITNTYGSVFVTFGPKDTSGTYTINATAVSNASAVNGALCINTGKTGTCSQDLKFHNTEPVDIIVSANPQSMASLDVDDSSHGIVQVKVVDINGNAVVGENVQFSIGCATYDYNYLNTTPPFILPTSAKTGDGTYAETVFTPGKFSILDSDFNSTATGSVTVTATWKNTEGTITKSQDVTFTWKNYPYLSITVPQDTCKDVKVGDKINVTVSIFGDGAALKPKPIDAVLVVDKSLTMDGTMGTKTRLGWAKIAGSTFVGKMDTTRDRVGLVTFSTDANVNYSLSNNFVGVNNAINSMQSVMYTGTRKGLKLAIEAFPPSNGKSVRAIILLTDGLYNYYGDPLARGKGYDSTHKDSSNHYYDWTSTYSDRHTYFSGLGGTVNVAGADQFTDQNMSIYAKNNNIRIYTVSFSDDIKPTDDTWKVLDNLANSTGGQHYHASTGAQLTDVYTKIAGQLQETAGGNTQVNLNFDPVQINGAPGNCAVPGKCITDYMEYEKQITNPYPYSTTDSTYLNKSNVSPSGSLYIYPGYPKTMDETTTWNTAHAMTYNVGDIRLNDTWSVTFRLNLTQMGQIVLFGPDSPSSKVCFTDASTSKTTCQGIQPLKCNIQQQKINIPFGDKSLFVDNLSAKSGGPDPNILTIKWNTTYDGEKVVLETISYHNQDIMDSHYNTVPGGILYEPKCYEKTSILTIDTTSWPAGHYSIRVLGQAVDAKSPGAVEVPWTKQGPNVPKYIKLE